MTKTIKMDIVHGTVSPVVELASRPSMRQSRQALEAVVGALPATQYTVAYELDPAGDYCVYTVPGWYYPVLCRCVGEVPTVYDVVLCRVPSVDVCFMPREWHGHRVSRRIIKAKGDAQ